MGKGRSIMEKEPLIVIVGPTAVGKTDIAIALAKSLDGEIVSADSMQIYKYMDIGTAKPTVEEREGIPHYMIDVVDPDQEFSVAQFQQEAKAAIEDINQRGKLPILAGGTGLYINSLIYPMDFTDAGEDPEFRKKMRALASEKGNKYLHKKLYEIDPDTAQRLHYNDIRRIIRALEVHHLTGKPMSHYNQNLKNADKPYNSIIIGLTMDRKKLYNRINHRVDIMLEKGLVEEVKGLLEMGYNKNLTSMQGLGYKEIIAYLEGKRTLTEATEILKRDTRRFAKRQYTWFKRIKGIYWVNKDDFGCKEELVKHLLKYIVKSLGK